MKIVQVNAVYGIGSTGRTTQEFHEWLLANGHESWVFASEGASKGAKMDDASRLGSGVYPFGTWVDHKMHALLSRVTGLQAHYSARATRDFVAQLPRIAPDGVILGNLHANYVELRTLLKALTEYDIPTLVFLHDCWFFTGKCTHYTSRGCYKWQRSCGCCPKLKGDIPSWFFDKTPYMLEEKRRLFSEIPRLGVVGVSDWILGESQKGLLSCAKNTLRLYNWIDLDVFKPCGDSFKVEHDIKGKMLLSVSSGWVAGSAKVRNLARLAEMLRDDETLVVVGSAKPSILPSNIMYIEQTSNANELARIYSAADVYVHLSEEDTFGKVIAEALACGTPAVTFDSTAYPELVSDGCGRVVTAGSLEDMRHAIDEVYHSLADYAPLCRAKAKVEFDFCKLAPRLLDFAQEVKSC